VNYRTPTVRLEPTSYMFYTACPTIPHIWEDEKFTYLRK
jgi:hypothetical protein